MPAYTNSFKKTRIAPTPSGFLHLGNVLSFAITAALAHKSGAKILLRIDDLDQPRVNKLYLQDIFDTLNFLEIPWHEGPRNVSEFERCYSQLHRMDMYRNALKQLADGCLVFACTCPRRNMYTTCTCRYASAALTTANASWRLITDNNRPLTIKTYNGIANTLLPAGMQNFVVKKKDGFAAYQLATVIDDIFYGMDLVVRGTDLWPSTLAQHELALALGENAFGGITFYHHQLLADAAGKKLSKSAGATSVKYLRESGQKAGHVYQLIASMLGINQTIISWQQLATAVLSSI